MRRFTFASAPLWLTILVAPAHGQLIEHTADSPTDGVTGTLVGGPESSFELYGIGYAQSDTDLYIGLNTNLAIGGDPNPLATGGSVAWGDIFLNFSDLTFSEAVATGNVYGIRFDAANDSAVPQLGLYQVQQTGSVTPTNSGFQSLADYQQVVQAAGGTPSLGALPLDGGYLSATELPQNVIAQGSLLSSEVSFIEDFGTVGFSSDFGFSEALPVIGTYTYGLSVDKTALPTGNFIAHLLAECANDGIAFIGELLAPEPDEAPESVPEPGISLALLAVAACGLSCARR